MTPRLPSLTSGHGLPGRQITLCDGRTSLRVRQSPEGFDQLVHYAPDSFYTLSRVLQGDTPMTWAVDGAPHRFDWVEAWPHGYTNREERPSGDVTSRAVVVQGGIAWLLSGVRRNAVFTLPRALFREVNVVGKDDKREVTHWTFPAARKGPWQAVRHEDWTFRDSSTYAGIEGASIPSEPRRSELHLCVAGSPVLSVSSVGGAFRFALKPAKSGTATLAVGLGSTAAEARAAAERLAADPDAALRAQERRYRKVAASAPALDFGRHTALRRFFELEPLFLESMRIREEPGAYRANNDYYWVWGWDMTRPAFGLLAGNQHEFVRQLLDFLAKTRFINQYDNTLSKDLRVCERQPGALEFMLAHDYLAWTGDAQATLPWKDAFVAALAQACDNPDPTGMSTGAAASTDYPEEFGRTFKAWMSYTTAWSYSGYCCAEKLLLAWGEDALAGRVRELAARVRRNFERVFWNPKSGFWNEGVHPTDPDLVCDIPLSTAMAAMDSPYGEDLYGAKLGACAAFCAREFLREDGVHIVTRNEVRGWKEWTRQPNNWFAANDTMLARLFRTVGDTESLEKLFYLYEINFGYQPAAFEGKPFRRPLNTSGSWQAFGAGAWYRNLVENAAGLWPDLGGLTVIPCGLGEPVELRGLLFRGARLHFTARGQGPWPTALRLDGQPIVGTTKLPPLSPGAHRLEVTYGPSVPPAPLVTLAVDAEVLASEHRDGATVLRLRGRGYTPIAFFSPAAPTVTLNGQPVPAEWDSATGRGRARALLDGEAELCVSTGLV